MDDLSGFLVEGFGLRPRDRSGPMAASKGRASARSPTPPPMPPPSSNPRPSWNASLLDDPLPRDDGLGALNSIFSGSGFRPSSPPVTGLDDDLFGAFSGSSGAPTKIDDNDIFGSFTAASNSNHTTAASEDLLGDFGRSERGSDVKTGNGASGLDELIPGFGESSPPRRNKSSAHETSTANMPKDPFIDLESTISASHSSSSFTNTFEEFDFLSVNMKSGKTSKAVFDFDEFQGSVPLFTSDVKTNSESFRDEEGTYLRNPRGFNGLDDFSPIDFLFAETKKKNDPLAELVTEPSIPTRPAGSNKVHAAPANSDQHERNSVKHAESADDIWLSISETSVFKQSSVSSSNIRKASSSPNILDDWNSFFGAPSSEEFQEIEGEPEERRRARLDRHRRTLERAAKALDEKNERDSQIERENAERHRISERLNADIKRWAAGKEGNLRALLSSLQYVIWPECGWEPVTLTDLITSVSVKKVYRKATLCIHPDKVQQKGANLQQKYTAEKVFDLLKEAWKKFNTEELS